MDPIPSTNHLLLPFVMIEKQDLKVSTEIKSNSEFENDPDEFYETDKEISNAIRQASKYATEKIDNIFNLSNIEDTDGQIYQTQIISTLNNTRIFYDEQLTQGMIFLISHLPKL
jgi:hypothetical protein